MPAPAQTFHHLTLWPATGARFGPVARSSEVRQPSAPGSRKPDEAPPRTKE